jgi:Transglycosylase SLT domain
MRRARRIGALLIAAFAAPPAAPASADQAAPPADNGLAMLCGIVETARREGLPVNFFTRLIWRESAFHSGAVSLAGAQGVAQFMPGAAYERGLADPFDPAAAIPASAKFLAELARRFGNLGLAAAAYNAGPNALADWLAGKGVLPLETQDYVLAITGHDVEEWRAANPPSSAAPDADKPCRTSIGNLRVAQGLEGSPIASGLFAPWSAQVAGSFSGSAPRAFARAPATAARALEFWILAATRSGEARAARRDWRSAYSYSPMELVQVTDGDKYGRQGRSCVIPPLLRHCCSKNRAVLP